MLREPYSKHLDEGIFELRCKAGSNIIRVLYFFYYEGKIVLTNGFVKKDAENAARRNCVGEGAKRGLYRKDVKIMKTLDSMLSEQLKDEEFRNEYEAIQPKMDVIRAIVDARTSQNLT